MRMHEVVGVHAVRQDHAAQVDVIVLDKLDRAASSLLSRRITIEHVDDPLGEAREGLDVVLGEGGAQHGNDVLDTGLPARHGADVTFHHDDLAGGDDMVLGPVEPVQVLALVENRGLGGIEVLSVGLFLIQRTAAERDAAPLLIEDGEHHTIEEPVDQAAVASRKRHVGIDHLTRGEPLLRKMRHQRAMARGKAQHVFVAGGRIEVTLLAVVAAATVFPAHEQRMVERSRLLAYVDQTAPLGAAALESRVIGQLNAGAVRQKANRLGEAQVFALHHIGEAVATLSTAKTMPHLGGGYNMKRRRLLPMERAASPQVVATGLELDRLLHKCGQIGGIAHAVLVLVRNHGFASNSTEPNNAAT